MGKKSGEKKRKKTKLPKEVMGIRLPKEVREIGGAVLEKANTPQGREMLAAGLTMAAAAASAAVAKGRMKRETAAAGPAPAPDAARAADAAPPPPPPAPPPQGTQRDPDPTAMLAMVGTVAESVLGKLFTKKG
ncbi:MULTISPECIES: hypothetical protein [unclassified Sphingomonas]|nr:MULTISPECIES: hypothetical protein [unclassified Sphingomonas]AXJ95629.1 hypothetical protein DM480_09005 [Sphingomonas sp. FARSPH]